MSGGEFPIASEDVILGAAYSECTHINVDEMHQVPDTIYNIVKNAICHETQTPNT